MPKPPRPAVRHRRVLYVPGFDPRHARRYRELYRKEAAAQAVITGYEIEITPRAGPRYGWNVVATIDGQTCTTEVEVLVWSDIVRRSMDIGIAATFWLLARTALIYVSTGALRRLMWLRKGPLIAAFYPVVMLFGQLALAVLIAWFILRAGGAMLILCGIPAPAAFAVAALAGIAAGVWLLRWFKKKDGKIFAHYLLHDYAFSARTRGANPPDLEARMTDFTAAIAEALNSDTDEVLVVAHSSGVHVAVSCLADLIRADRVPAPGPSLSFLSLGQVIPMVSFLPDAHRLRADLNFLSTRDELTWVDVTAPGDGCAFALCDPVAVSGVAPKVHRWPLVISAAFSRTLTPETWKALRWRFFRLHFQYLCAFDAPGDYDYFQITAGPLSLGERYAGRKPSASRIDVAASCHTSMAA